MRDRRARLMRAAIRAIAMTVLLAGPRAYAQVVQFSLEAQDATTGIPEFARQAGLQIIAPADQLKGIRTHRVVGSLDAHEALRQLLEGTGLVVASDDGHTISIRLPADKVRAQDSEPTRRASDAEGGVGLEEIIVTAQKRGEERLQDVPIPVSVLGAQTLAEHGQLLLRDYYASVPGLRLLPSFEDSQFLAIRGVTTGSFTNPTVGITVDDVPFGGSTTTLGAGTVPDFDPGDLDRIEVLRGPQGTLYGANSMGGLLRYVTRDPSTDAFSARVQAGTRGIHNGSQLGYDFRASANVPLSDTLAMRASGFEREDPGYIDDVTTGQEGVNEARAKGAHLSALWRPSQDFSMKLSALYQEVRGDGTSEVYSLPGLADLQQSTLPDTGAYDTIVEAYSALLNYRVAGVQVTSLTGYNIDQHDDTLDYTATFGPAMQAQYGVSGARLHTHGNTHKFTQELRVAGGIGPQIDWLLGGFYTHENAPDQYQSTAPVVPATGQVVGEYYRSFYPRKFEEYAGFANLTYRITDRLDIQLGGRESRTREDDAPNIKTGPYTLITLHVPSPDIIPAVQAKGNSFTYLVTPRFKVSADLMMYARFASGYRPGGGNVNALAAAGLPPLYDPDKTQNYELGLKGDFLDRTLSVDASVYYIDWKNIQIGVLDPTTHLSYTANGGEAKSEGVELAATVRPLRGLSVTAWVDYDNAVLTSEFPPTASVHGVSGDRLPNTSKYSGNLSLQQDFPLWSGMTGFVGAQASYVGDRVSLFRPTAARQSFPSYTQTDLSAGARYDSWTVNLYVNNVADVRGMLDGGVGYLVPTAFYYITPRTIGMNLSKTF